MAYKHFRHVRKRGEDYLDPVKILIIEDDHIQNDVLSNFLKKEGYQVVSAYSLSEAEELFDPSVKLMILDVMLPDGNGLDYLKAVRSISTVPVIVLTALDDDFTKLKTFGLKADEYVDKPVSPLVMTKRVNAFVERFYGASDTVKIGQYTFDFSKYTVTAPDGSEMKLTQKETGIVRFLYDAKGNAVTRDAIITNLWGCDYESEERAIDTHIKNIRKKLDPDIILTVKGIGYRLNG